MNPRTRRLRRRRRQDRSIRIGGLREAIRALSLGRLVARRYAVSSERCDAMVFKHGFGICSFHERADATEIWVQTVAKASGERVDWHYSGGMVNVLYLGDYDRVRRAVRRFAPALRCYVRILDRNAHGLYRCCDPVPEGVVAVVTTGMP